MSKATEYIDIVFDGPPSHEAPRFVEVESPAGTGIRLGTWVERPDGFWALRFDKAIAATASPERVDVSERLAFRAGFFARDKIGPVLKDRVGQEAYFAWDTYKRETAQPTRCGSCGQMITSGAMCVPCRNSD